MDRCPMAGNSIGRGEGPEPEPAGDDYIGRASESLGSGPYYNYIRKKGLNYSTNYPPHSTTTLLFYGEK